MDKLTPTLDLDAEVVALAEFISAKWTPIANITQLFTEIRDAAMHAARAWIDKHRVWEVASKMEDDREAMLREVLGLPESNPAWYDAYCTLLSHVAHKASALREAGLAVDGEWDFECRENQVAAKLADKYDSLVEARPLGWAALAENYVDFDGQAEYDPKPDRALFKGARVEGTLSACFPGRVALPYVMYDEVCQGRRAYRVLVGAVYAHFLGIAEYLNTTRLIDDLQAAVTPAVQFRGMLYERKVESQNPLLQFMLADLSPCPPKASFEESLAHQAAFAALTPEEQAARHREGAVEFEKMIEELLVEDKMSAREANEREKADLVEKGKRLSQLIEAAKR